MIISHTQGFNFALKCFIFTWNLVKLSIVTKIVGQVLLMVHENSSEINMLQKETICTHFTLSSHTGNIMVPRFNMRVLYGVVAYRENNE